MKNGLYHENGELIYYRNDVPMHAGAVCDDGDIYYISSGGKAVKGSHFVCREKCNNILKPGTYSFGEDYKLVDNSFIAPKNDKKNISKRKALLYSLVLLAIMLSTVLFVFGIENIYLGKVNPLPSESGASEDGLSSEVSAAEVALPVFKEEVLLCSPQAKKYYDGELSLSEAIVFGNAYRPFVFNCRINGTGGKLFLGENKDFSAAEEYPLACGQNRIVVDNLKTGTEYYYKVVVSGEEYSGTFITAKSPRFVSIPGIVNTRDIGGYTTLDGKTVKQGLLIRGIEIDGLVEESYLIPPDSIPSVQETFGFVYDLDLRSHTIFNGEYSSPLGKDVGHKFYQSPQYHQLFEEPYYISKTKEIFSDLADPEKYPMYLHCSYGTDRTGTIIFLLQGVLNVPEEDMIKEYKLTAFDFSYVEGYSYLDTIIKGVQPYSGETLQEKIVSYLKEYVGVTEDEIESIRTIFLG